MDCKPRFVRGIRRDDELFPQPVGMLTGELTRYGVEVAHPLDGDQEGFVGCQAGIHKS